MGRFLAFPPVPKASGYHGLEQAEEKWPNRRERKSYLRASFVFSVRASALCRDLGMAIDSGGRSMIAASADGDDRRGTAMDLVSWRLQAGEETSASLSVARLHCIDPGRTRCVAQATRCRAC